MKFKMIKIGKINRKEIINLVADYEKRLRTLINIETFEYKDHPPAESSNTGTNKSTKKIKKDPLQIIKEFKKIPGDFMVILDERGKNLSSLELANFIKKKTEDPLVKSISFVIGGAYGVGESARTEADFIWSLSNAVLPNEIAWLIAWEQIYRAHSIIQGTPYHHDN
ncbi:MAG: 23S rRNA (pseudouridine(1915)-N(3))-methyltransferase RlmH [Bdellovibrionota bacterium]